ncbi:MAG: tetratricopeptide repeat protein [Candidatus Omnitrophica bacterium]|nr:tetratricopeptide repeat protein [Candidatus Omnitrophota bacterium]
MKKSVSSPNRIYFLSMILVMLMTVLVYLPSAFHVARSDQENYFAETAHLKGLTDTVVHTYSYSRQRIFFSGDFQMFKPLYFVLLAAEKEVFGFNPFGWQVAGIILHLLVVWQLFRLLYLISPGIGAVFVSGYFAVMLITQDMVTFQHMNICLVAHILILESFIGLIKYIDSNFLKRKYFYKILGCVAAACFLREFSLVYTVIIFCGLIAYQLYASWSLRPLSLTDKATLISRIKLWLWLWAPIVVYMIWNVTDYWARVKAALNVEHVFFSVKPALHFIGLSWWGGLIPGLIKYHMPVFPQNRVIAEFPSFSLMITMMVDVIGIIGIVSFIIFLKKKKINFLNSRLLTGWAALLCSLSYAVIVTWGRFQDRGMESLYYNMYYFYAPVFFNMIFGYVVYSTVAGACKCRHIKIVNYLLGLALILFGAWNAWGNYRLNLHLEKESRPLIARQKNVGFRNYFLSKRYNALGFYSAQQGQWQTAAHEDLAAIIVDPQNADAYFNLGIVYFNAQDFKNAASYLTRALFLTKDKSHIYYNRAVAYIKLQEFDKALDDLNEVMLLSPLNSQARQLRDYLSRSTHSIIR